MHKIFILGLAICTQVKATDLMQTYHDAQANDPAYSRARHVLAANREQMPQARAALLPTVGIDSNYSGSSGDASVTGNNRPYNWESRRYALSLSQPLFRMANWEQYQQSKLAVASGEVSFALAMQDLILRVCQAYFDVLNAQEALKSVQMQKEAIREQLASTQRSFEVGNTTVTDKQEAKSRLDLALVDEFSEASNLEIKRAALQQIIGKPLGVLADLGDDVSLPAPQPVAMQQWIDSSKGGNYNIVFQELRLEIARREISKARAGYLPTVDLVISRSRTNQNGNSPTQDRGLINANSVGVQLNIPIFSGFYVDSKVRESLSVREQADDDLELARRNAEQEVRISFFGVASGLARVKALEAAQLSSQLVVKSTKLGYAVGMRINIDVLNAQQQLYLARRDLSKARYDTIMNGLRLKAAVGTLREDDVAQINTLLQN